MTILPDDFTCTVRGADDDIFQSNVLAGIPDQMLKRKFGQK
jgi:hypothetical protein